MLSQKPWVSSENIPILVSSDASRCNQVGADLHEVVHVHVVSCEAEAGLARTVGGGRVSSRPQEDQHNVRVSLASCKRQGSVLSQPLPVDVQLWQLDQSLNNINLRWFTLRWIGSVKSRVSFGQPPSHLDRQPVQELVILGHWCCLGDAPNMDGLYTQRWFAIF